MPNKNHYPLRKIVEINPETDFRVKIMGIVVDKKDDTIVVDDGTDKVKEFVDLPSILDKVNVNHLVAVFGATIPTDLGIDIKANVIQNLTGLDINLYKKVEELYNKWGVN